MPKSKKWIPVKTMVAKIIVAFQGFCSKVKTSSGTIMLPDQRAKGG